MTYFNSERSDRALDREMAGYVKLLTEEKIKAGMDPESARRAALVEVGGVEQVKERVRDVRPGVALETLWRDVRYAARSLARSPGFTVVAVVTLALGLGANTAIFSVVNGVILRPLPYPDPEQLVAVASTVNSSVTSVSPRDLMDWRNDARSFSGLAGAVSSSTILTGSDGAEQLSQARLTTNTFDVLSVRPILGRAFLPGEDAVGAPRVAILSEALWRRRFGADSGIVGRSVTLDGFPTLVIGVAPAALQAWRERTDIFLTTRFSERDLAESSRGARYVTVVGRLAPGASIESARAEMEGIAQRLEQLDPRHNTNVGVRLRPLLADTVGNARKPLLILLGAVGFVLLIACANVGSLMLGRVAARDAELAVRTALGATRLRIARQLLTESLLLAAAGGIIGLALAFGAVRAIIAFAPAMLPRIHEVQLDAGVLAFAFAATTLTALLFGVMPSLKGSALDVHERLRAGARGQAGRAAGSRSRRSLVVAQVALAIVLLAGTGLLLRSLVRLRDVDPGFTPDGVVTFATGQLPRHYGTKEQELAFTASLLENLRRLPGVTAADVSFNLPLEGGGPQFTFEVRGGPPADPRNEPRAQARSAGPDYFAAMGIPLLRGRMFDATDRGGPNAPQVLLISAEVARRYFPDSDPIGKYIQTGWGGPGWPGAKFGGEVIGVVGDVRQRSLESASTAHLYMPYQQWPINEYDVVIRSTRSPEEIFAGARAVLKRLDPMIPMNAPRSLADVVSGSFGDRKFYFRLLALFAGVALCLVVVGVYGVVAYGVRQRQREIGIRLALGASGKQVLGMILSDGLRMVVAGVALGVLASLTLTRLLGALLFETGARDPLTLLVAPLVLIAAAAAACLLPARRASRLDPVETIRAE